MFEVENPDATFTHFDALRPFKAELTAEAATLAAKRLRSNEDEQTLEDLEEQLRYIGKVEQARRQQLGQEDLERDNRILRPASKRLSLRASARPGPRPN